jgi:hypothetical protein
MAKSQIRSYVFTPGAAGVGTIKVPGKVDLNQLLIITNTTRNVILYNFADTTNASTAITFTRANDTNFTTALDSTDGITTITLQVNTASHSANDTIQIFYEKPFMDVRMPEIGTDAFERTRISAPMSMLDADFEYGLQPTKWQAVSMMRGYPSIYEIPGTDTTVTAITTNAATGESLITVTTSGSHGLLVGGPFTIKGLNTSITGFSRAEGSFIIFSVPTTSSFTYYAKAQVGSANGDSLYSPIIQLRKGGFYTGAAVSAPQFTYSAAATPVITITFPAPHGFVAGGTILVYVTSDSGDTQNHKIAGGPFFIESTPSATTLTYTARSAAVITGTIGGLIYARPDSWFLHRPLDGGVILSTGGPAYGSHAIRMSKKYIRYQSGKAINYNTGALFAPNYDIKSVNSSGTSAGSVITIVTDDVDHNCQIGATIQIAGVFTSGYNGTYTVASIVDERTLTVLATTTLGATSTSLDGPCYMVIKNWTGAVVRAGTFDDQNGPFFQYDGNTFAIGRRSSTFQISGTATVAPDSNTVTGVATRFASQLVAGDRVVIRGMTHVVTNIASDTTMYISPDYRGTNTSSGIKIAKTLEYIVPQSKWNVDRCDGTGGVFNPSGYNIDAGKMQMIGLQWTWYGAGFTDWMMRGPTGQYITVHRLRGNNLNREAYQRSGNSPVRYEVVNEGARSQLTAAMDVSQTTIPVADLTFFPTAGTVYIDNEFISYTGKSASTGAGNLTGATRTATFTHFVAGFARSFSAGTAATHAIATGVIQVACTATPNISHWGSAYIQDGGFDSDRGYLFNYSSTNLQVTTTKQTAFMIRLAPSVSNAIIGDLGDRDLINRAQLLLQSLEITSDGYNGSNAQFTGGIVVEGVLNPQNYPTNVSDVTWTGLQSSGAGGLPSFSQVASGGSVVWAGGASQTTTAITTAAFPTGSITVELVPGGANSVVSGSPYLYITTTNYNTYLTSGLTTGQGISGSNIASGSVINSINFWGTYNSVSYYYVTLSKNATGNTAGAATLTATNSYPVTRTSQIFFQKASWEATNATNGTEVNTGGIFPGGTYVSTTTLVSYFGTQYYRVTFNQTSDSSTITPASTSVTFKFGQPPYAQPGEQIFSFISAPGNDKGLDLSGLKELTNTVLGGRGTYPNGPDVLAINIYRAAGSGSIPCNLVLRWSEAQA